MHPLTDIVVLVHNNYSVTKQFADSLFANTKNFNLIFVDNGSADKVKEYLADGHLNGRWQLIRSEENLGVIGGRNLGAKSVTSDFFINLDNDQIPQPHWLEQLHQTMEQGFDIVGVEAWCLRPPNSPESLVINNKSYRSDYYPFRMCKKANEKFTYVGCGGMLLKKKVYDDIGLFDERFSPSYFEDPDLVFRAIQKGYKVGWCHNCNIKHLGHQTLNTQKTFDKQKQFLRSWDAFKKKWHPFYSILSNEQQLAGV